MPGIDFTRALAFVAGGYLVLSSAGFLRKGDSEAFFDDWRAHAGAVHAAGAVSFFAGALILAFH